MPRSRAFRMAATLLTVAAAVASCGQRSAGGGTSYVPQTANRAAMAAPEGGAKIGILGTGRNAKLDAMVVTFMRTYRVPNAQLAVSSRGKTVFSHAYTYEGLAKSTTTTSTIMRLASITKAWTDAAMYQLIRAHEVNPNAKVFAYLGITKPLPASAKVDPRVYRITIEDMILHESGWDDGKSGYDPTFGMRATALDLGLKRAIDPTQYVQAQLAQPLQEAPGTTYAYCNFCYSVLGMVIAKASGTSYADYIAKKVAAPLKLDNVRLSPTIGKRLPHEVAEYYSAYSGPSAIYVLSKKQYPYPYGGDGMILEIAGGASALATNAESMLAYMNDYVIWGVGTPQPGAHWAREGSMPGTNSWSDQLPNGKNFAFIVNTRQYDYPADTYVFENLQAAIEQVLDPGVSPADVHRFSAMSPR
ncbi:MAG TPA: serine hydrolase domain-containing protein [Candidatus Acidoferrales bacterium]|nr:serine hydrolase domain-containing protein [Candidatus Acidoferrales bacterium]